MTKALIKIRKKPVKPKRKKLAFSEQIDDGATLLDIMIRLKCKDPSQVYVSTHYDYDSDGKVMYANYDREQTDVEYKEDLLRYQKRLEEYDKWYEEHKEIIKAELIRKQKEDEEETQRILQKKQKILENKLKEIKKRLK